MMLFKGTFAVALLVLETSFAQKVVDTGPFTGRCAPPPQDVPLEAVEVVKVVSERGGGRLLSGWFPCGTNTHCVKGRATCAVVDDIGTCTCNDGFAGPECRQENECETQSPCPGGSVCVDMDPPQKFKCDCKEGFTPFLPNELPDEPEVTLANRPVQCLDQNECEAEASPCHPDATCTNTVGRFECVCKEGFVGNGITTCEEPAPAETATEAPPVGSCQVSTDCQGSNMDCVDFQCVCFPGYAMVGANCQNEVHCDPGGFNNDCHRRATCTEEDGDPGFSCACIEGWEDAFEGANGKACKDIPPVTEAPPPEPITEAATLPAGVGPHPNRPTVFQPTCLAEGATCSSDGVGGACCAGSVCLGEIESPCINNDQVLLVDSPAVDTSEIMKEPAMKAPAMRESTGLADEKPIDQTEGQTIDFDTERVPAVYSATSWTDGQSLGIDLSITTNVDPGPLAPLEPADNIPSKVDSLGVLEPFVIKEPSIVTAYDPCNDYSE